MEAWTIIWQQRAIFLEGFFQTILLFGLSGSMAFLSGIAILMALEGPDNPLRRAIRLLMDGMRMIPCLIYAYLLYYGLPPLGIRLDAWTAGCLALTTYHAAYFAEILRGARAELSPGQVEAARSHGFRTLPMFVRIIVPQLLLRTGPVLGNQLIICLKDTSFLTIITVAELTSAATSVQAQYFIPVQAFVVAIALYWLVCLGIERCVRHLGRAATIRGLRS
ncbi:amino acid ABC transporter permease [Ralstonia syzygii]|uniref:Amino acid ABC transporter, permease protein n=1 Tax=Ralstonia syzygii R24 TaxID=907261 RepID=G3A903_9RALS|nr:amino acid ABC transporter permease [Ralstonia syzygii]CCA87743.1 amino acid ABC transporter, permease protein [Ralstonia syzygii R24]